MEMKKELRMEISGIEAEQIVSDYVTEKMKGMGYMLSFERNEDETPWPDMFYRGVEINS